MDLNKAQANRIANTSPKLYHLGKWDNLSHPQKLEVISDIIRGEGRDPAIAELAVGILRQAGVAPRDYKRQAAALLQWTQDNIYYINEPGERLQSPKYTLKRGFGDCDDMAIFLCSLYETIGLPWKLVLSGNHKGKRVRHIQGDKILPGVEWAHIYCAVGDQPFNPTQWLFAEPTIQKVPLGWDVVSSDVNMLPELLNPRYSGLSLGANEVVPPQNQEKGFKVILQHIPLHDILIAALAGTITSVASALILEYIRSKRTEKQ